MYSRVNSQLLEDRLDAEFYSLEQIRNHRTLQDYGVRPLSAFCNGINVGYTGELTSVYVNQGTTLYRVSDISGVFLSNDDVNYVPDDFASGNPQIWIRDNDIVFAAVGNTIGKVALKTKSMPDGVCSRALMIARPLKEKVDSSFLIAYLATKYAQKSLLRGVSGSAQPVLNTPLIANLPVISVDAVSQKYIGDKVRRAEQLRAWAKRLEAEFQGKLAESYPEAFENKRTGKKYSKAPVDDISYTLNPGAFDEERLRIRLYLKSLGAVKLREFATIEGPTSSNFLPETKYIGLDAISSNSCAISPSTIGASEVIGTSRLLSEGPIVAKLRPYLNKVSYIPKWLSGAVGSTELLCVKSTDVTSNWYLYGALKSDITLQQLKPVASGSTHPRIDQYDLYDVVIPIHHDHQLMGSWLEEAQCAYFAAAQLAQAAKTLVEALIEEQITEQQLIQAQQAVDDGEISLDQAILSKLSTKGYAIEGATPLFSDMDELYSLLQRAAQAETEV